MKNRIPPAIVISIIAMSMALTAGAGDIKHTFVATDESGHQLIYVDEANPGNDWTVPLPGNRDIQISTEGTVLVNVPSGYREYDLKTGEMLKEVTVDIHIKSLVRLDNGHTFLGGGNGVIELDENDKEIARHEMNMGGFFRLLRLATNGNFLYTASRTSVKELTPGGATVRELDLTTLTPESAKPYFMEEMDDGGYFISTGFGATILVVDKDWKLIKSYGGKGKLEGIATHFFADAQQLANGHVVVAHWTGHKREDSQKAPQAIEFDENGKVVWTWHDAKRAGTLHGIEIIE
ncbi:MAG: hypothetical protein HN341_19770 [Verrucomicrobia bacterium]|jgi:hypothetical protein|nr:hypothetical protein [Verrucomicrobiota bacterium]